MSISADFIVDLFERDARARKRLAELLISEPDIRLAIINAVLRDVATKGDIEKIRGEYATKEDVKILRSEIDVLRSEIEKIRVDLIDVRERLAKLEGIVSQIVARIGDLDKRIDALDKRIDALDKRIDSMDRRIDSMDKRLDYVAKISWTLTIGVITTLIANIVLMALRIPR